VLELDSFDLLKMAPRRKLKEELDPGTQYVEPLAPDQTKIELEKAFLGTIVMDVRWLSTTWKTGKQREIDVIHLNGLKESFKAGVRQYAKESRMLGLCSEDTFIALIQHHTTRMQAQAKTDRPIELDAMIAKTRSYQGSTYSDFVYLTDYPQDVPKPTLAAGQHRRAALLSIIDEQQKAADDGVRTGPNGDVVPPPTVEVSLSICSAPESTSVRILESDIR
jgi:hypothetical protein